MGKNVRIHKCIELKEMFHITEERYNFCPYCGDTLSKMRNLTRKEQEEFRKVRIKKGKIRKAREK